MRRPFVKIGDRIRYLSPHGNRSRNTNWPDGAWLENGIKGTVIEYHPTLPKTIVGGKVFERIPPYAVVKFDNGASTCIDGDKKGRTRWELIIK